MADLRIKSGTSSVDRGVSDATMVDVRGTRDGAMFTAPWLTALALEGRCFGINTGTGTAPDALGTTYDATKPDAYITVPSGTTVIPVLIEVTFEDVDTSGTNIIDCMAVLSAVADTATTSTAVVIYNMRTDAPIASNCSAVAVVTGNGTTPLSGNFIEFWRGTAGYVEDANAGSTAPTSELNSKTVWDIRHATVPPVIVGSGSLSVYTGKPGAGVTGWITVIWAEIPSTSIV